MIVEFVLRSSPACERLVYKQPHSVEPEETLNSLPPGKRMFGPTAAFYTKCDHVDAGDAASVPSRVDRAQMALAFVFNDRSVSGDWSRGNSCDCHGVAAGRGRTTGSSCPPNRGIQGGRKKFRRCGSGGQEHDHQPAREGGKSDCVRGSKGVRGDLAQPENIHGPACRFEGNLR